MTKFVQKVVVFAQSKQGRRDVLLAFAVVEGAFKAYKQFKGVA